jgi:hypothetical protein
VSLITGIIGIAILLAFLGVLMWWIKAVPLITIVVCVVALLVYDFVQTVRQK